MRRPTPLSQGEPPATRVSRADIEAFVGLASRDAAVPEPLNAAVSLLLKGRLSPEELRHLSLALRSAGDLAPLPTDRRPAVSYATVGGPSDKLSLLLPPVLAALGLRMPVLCDGIPGGCHPASWLSGSVPGFDRALSRDQFISVLQEVGCAIAAAPPECIPAVRGLCRPGADASFRAASMLAARLVPGIGALLVEVVFGKGSWVGSEPDAIELGRALMAGGADLGVPTRVILSPLEAPRGRSVGAWLEVREVAECLDCRGDAELENCLVDRAARCLVMVGMETQLGAAAQRVQVVLASGAAKASWERMLAAQGADLVAYREQLIRDSLALHVIECPAPDEGFVQGYDLGAIDRLVDSLAGGEGNPWVGVDRLVVPGEVVGPGTLLGRVHAPSAEAGAMGVARLASAIRIGPESQGCEAGTGGLDG